MNKEEKLRYLKIMKDLCTQTPLILPDELAAPYLKDLKFICLSLADYEFIKPFLQNVRIDKFITFRNSNITINISNYNIVYTFKTADRVYLLHCFKLIDTLSVLTDEGIYFMLFKRSYESYLGG